MSLIFNAWYAGARADELADGPVSRYILGQPVVLYRMENGTPVALLDVCPHRAVPLSKGRVERDRIICPYHGLEFDGAGVCRHNPHVKGPPDRLSVRPFPVVDKYRMIWIWPGDPDLADAADIPDLSQLLAPHLTFGSGYTHMAADYRLLIDNLMDLSHAEYIHPDTVGTPGSAQVLKQTVQSEGEGISIFVDILGMPPSAVFAQVWNKTELVDQYGKMTWMPVSCLFLDAAVTAPGADPSQGVRLPSAHVLTPETENTTHYFWFFGRNFDLGNARLTQITVNLAGRAFTTQDKPMIEAAQERISRTGAKLANFSPGDSASARARAILRKMMLDTGPDLSRAADANAPTGGTTPVSIAP